MSWSNLAFVLSLGLLVGRSSALKVIEHSSVSEDAVAWWYPVAGVLRVYDWNDDLSTVAPHHLHASRNMPQALSLISETSSETRVHAGSEMDAIGHHAGATVVASEKVIVNVSTGNTFVANVSSAVSMRGKDTAKMPPIAAVGWMVWMRATLSLGFLVKSACMFTNICYQASPIALIGTWKAKKDTGDADIAPYIALAYSGWQWCFYGMFAYVVTGKSGFLVLVYSNVVGATLGIYYVYAFVSISKNFTMIEKSNKYYYVLCVIVAVQFCAIMTQQPVRALFFSGLISSAWSTITSCSLLATVPIVYETKSSASLPLPLLVVGFMSGFLWIVCGVMLWDPWITFPNTIALTVCTYALYLCYKFPAGKDCTVEDVSDSDDNMGDLTARLDVERASPLQRALGFVSRSTSETQLLAETTNGHTSKYGSTGAVTGGTGESF